MASEVLPVERAERENELGHQVLHVALVDLRLGRVTGGLVVPPVMQPVRRILVRVHEHVVGHVVGLLRRGTELVDLRLRSGTEPERGQQRRAKSDSPDRLVFRHDRKSLPDDERYAADGRAARRWQPEPSPPGAFDLPWRKLP